MPMPRPGPAACTSRCRRCAACWTRSRRRSMAASSPAKATPTAWTSVPTTWISAASTARSPTGGQRGPEARHPPWPSREAIDLYAGDLLPEEGPAEWVAERRDHYRAKAIEAAQGLAEEALLAGDHATVVRACRFGLELDRYQDALWRMLILARERAGDAGAASRDRREYALVLEALGVEASGSVGPS